MTFELLHYVFKDHYIDPLPVEDIQADMEDLSCVHHDITTALKVCDKMLGVIPQNME